MDGLADILNAITNAKTPLAIFIILAVVVAAIVWQVSKRATLSEKTTQILVIGGYGLVGLLIVAGVATVFLTPITPPPPPPQKVTDVTISGKVFAGGDQRAGVQGATVNLETPTMPQRVVATDSNGEYFTHFQVSKATAGFLWVTDDKYNPTQQSIFSIDPADPTPDKQFIDVGAPKVQQQLVAINTPPPQTAPASAPQTAAPASTLATPPSVSQPAPQQVHLSPGMMAAMAHYHHVALSPSAVAAFHAGATPASTTLNLVMSPKLVIAQQAAMPAAAPPPPPPPAPRTDYNALYGKITNDEIALCNAATAAFDDGQYAQVIKFVLRAQQVSKTGVWKLAYPKLAAAYFLTGQPQQGNAALAQMQAQQAGDAKSGGLLSSQAARGYLLRDMKGWRVPLSAADRSAIDRAMSQ